MSPRVHFAYYALWIAHPVLHSLVAGCMYWRKLNKTFPMFFNYVLSQILIFMVVFPLYLGDNYSLFFYVYSACVGVSAIIGFKVIYEVFLNIFRPYHALKDLGSVLFMWAGLVMLLVAGVVAAASSAGQDGPLWQAAMTGQRCVRVVQVGLILFLLIFSKYLGVSLREHSFGIALGFGVFACVELMLAALLAGGYMGNIVSSLINMAGYNATILTWLAYVYSKSPARDNAANLLKSQRWDQSLNDLQHPVTADSLIPMFEGMVDRAFSRTNVESAAEEAGQLVSHRMSTRPERDPLLIPPRLSSDL